jgi:hypothetical protein
VSPITVSDFVTASRPRARKCYRARGADRTNRQNKKKRRPRRTQVPHGRPDYGYTVASSGVRLSGVSLGGGSSSHVIVSPTGTQDTEG